MDNPLLWGEPLVRWENRRRRRPSARSFNGVPIFLKDGNRKDGLLLGKQGEQNARRNEMSVLSRRKFTYLKGQSPASQKGPGENLAEGSHENFGVARPKNVQRRQFTLLFYIIEKGDKTRVNEKRVRGYRHSREQCAS